MPTWDAEQYLRFAEERTQPCRDLVARIALASPFRVIDLGCGPGNSTGVLAERWPQSKITGLDNSPEMTARARADRPQLDWLVGDIGAWQPDEPFDVVFSNAALQWLPDHRELLPRLLRQVAPGGVLAVQMPGDPNALPHRLIRELAASGVWRERFPVAVREWSVETPEFYYDVLSPQATRIEAWLTDYHHVLPEAAAISEWYRGTGLRPYLDALGDEESQRCLVADFAAMLTKHYPPRADGQVLFPFRRLFLLAWN